MDPSEAKPQASFTPPGTLCVTHPGLREERAEQQLNGRRYAGIQRGKTLAYYVDPTQVSAVSTHRDGKEKSRKLLHTNNRRAPSHFGQDGPKCCQYLHSTGSVAHKACACAVGTRPGPPEGAPSMAAQAAKPATRCHCLYKSKTFKHSKKYRSASTCGTSGVATEQRAIVEKDSCSNRNADTFERTTCHGERERRITARNSDKREYGCSAPNARDDGTEAPSPCAVVNSQADRVTARRSSMTTSITNAKQKDTSACVANTSDTCETAPPEKANDGDAFIKKIRDAHREVTTCAGERSMRQGGALPCNATEQQSTALQLVSACAAFPSKYTDEPKTHECLRWELKNTGCVGAKDIFSARFFTCHEYHGGSYCHHMVCSGEAGASISTRDSPDASERRIHNAGRTPGSFRAHTSRPLPNSDNCSGAENHHPHSVSTHRTQASQRSAEPRPVARSSRKQVIDTSQGSCAVVYGGGNAQGYHRSSLCLTPLPPRPQSISSHEKHRLAPKREPSDGTRSKTKEDFRPRASNTVERRDGGGHTLHSVRAARKNVDVTPPPCHTWSGRVPPLPQALQHLSSRLTGKCEHAELRSLTQIQQCVLTYVAQAACSTSAAARERLFRKPKHTPQDELVAKAKLEKTESAILHHVPLILPLDVCSGAAHCLLDGIYRRCSIPHNRVAVQRRARRQKDKALFRGLYDHASVRPEHQPTHGILHLKRRSNGAADVHNCCEAFLVLKNHVRVRVSISTAQNDEAEQRRIGTLSDMWHVLETLAPDEFSAVVPHFQRANAARLKMYCNDVLAKWQQNATENIVVFHYIFDAHFISPQAAANDMGVGEVPRECEPLLEFHVHGGVDMRRDVEAIAVQRLLYETTGLHQDFIHRLSVKFLLPVFSTEEFDELTRDADMWARVVRERADNLLIHRAAVMGCTCDYV